MLEELRSYSEFVAPNSYIVATDGIMQDLVNAPRSQADWSWNNPAEAAAEFARENNMFVIEEPVFLFNEGTITERVTYWPSCYLRRIFGQRTAGVGGERQQILEYYRHCSGSARSVAFER